MVPPVQLCYYTLLMIDRTATSAEIQEAFKTRVRALPSSRWQRAIRFLLYGESVRLLAQARDTLCDPALRRRYDAHMETAYWHWPPPG